MSENDWFEDVLRANEQYALSQHDRDLPGRAARGLAVLTCMDPRIDPLAILGLSPGDAAILRNAGARVTDDVLRTLVLASYLLGVSRVMVVAHTGCRMTVAAEADVHSAIQSAGGPDTRSLSFLTTSSVDMSLEDDVQKIHSYPYLQSLQVGGFVLDLDTGQMQQRC